MPPEWEEEFWHEGKPNLPGTNGRGGDSGPSTPRPAMYNTDEYYAALKHFFATPQIVHMHLNERPGNFSGASSPESSGSGASKFQSGSDVLSKLELDLRQAFASFLHDFLGRKGGDGIGVLLDSLKLIQNILDDGPGLRGQRKLLVDEQKCLQCVKLCLKDIESVSKLTDYSGGLYCLAAATVSTVTTTRILALEILACICTEGGVEGHYKVTEAISTLRLRLGEPIRCKLLVGALASAPPGTFQAKGIRFLTAWVSSAPSPKHKVHIQCELEEAGFNPQTIRKAAEMGGAKESREVQAELDEWERIAIDVDTLTRQNCQLRNSVATLQQELATLKDKLKRMEPRKSEDAMLHTSSPTKRTSRPKRVEENISTPVDSEEEAEQIHQILEDLNNIVNNELNAGMVKPSPAVSKKEKDIVPVHLVKSPPKRSPGSNSNGALPPPALHKPRPWPGSSASDDDDSDILDFPASKHANVKTISPPPQFDTALPPEPSPSYRIGEYNGSGNASPKQASSANVRKVVAQLEKSAINPSPKIFQKHKVQTSPKPAASAAAKAVKTPTALLAGEPKPDYTLPNFHKQNHMASKFANFKSSKLQAPLNDNSLNRNNYQDQEQHMRHSGGRPRFSPDLDASKKINTQNGLRRSESLHASLASLENDKMLVHKPNMQHDMVPNTFAKGPRPDQFFFPHYNSNNRDSPSVLSWKSMENLENSRDENFTLRWRYPHPEFGQPSLPPHTSLTPSPKNSKGKTQNKTTVAKLNTKNNVHGDFHLVADYRQNRFTKNTKSNSSSHPSQHPNKMGSSSSSSSPSSGPTSLFTRYTKKATEKPIHFHPQQQHLIPNNINEYHKEKDMKLFSLPPMLMTPNHDLSHRICDIPSGLY